MHWHLSKSDPRKVYDSYHNTVCVCQTADQASLIVGAVNASGKQQDAIKLREPSFPAEKEESAKVSQSTGSAPALPDTWESDECCGKPLTRALRSGILRTDDWLCPSCGAEWKAEQRGAVRHWTPAALVALLRI
jgi:hypothetical protein